MTKHDLVIRSGTVVDGTGAKPRTADVAVDDGVITAVGRVDSKGTREIDADGLHVTPGFVDIHTHYDGQATWDAELAPSSWHGVTTAVMGNCGVGFAPVRPEDRNRLIELMEGVEDIPGIALHAGLSWDWESFGDYMDALDVRPRDIDLGTQLPHAPLRVYVMGERGALGEPATSEDITEMAAITRAAVRAGVLGFTTSRSLNHRSSTGDPTPSLRAGHDELLGIAMAMSEEGRGVLQVVGESDVDDFAMLKDVAARSRRPMSVSVAQNPVHPDGWQHSLDAIGAAADEGIEMRAQVGARAVGLILAFDGTLHPFMEAPLWGDLRRLDRAERAARLHDPDIRRILIEQSSVDRSSSVLGSRLIHKFHLMYPLGDPPNYEPDPAGSIAASAARAGITPEEVAYDLLVEGDATGMLYLPSLNYVEGNLDVVGRQLAHPRAVAGLSDGGAHVGTICDVSFPTFLLQWWARDRARGTLPLELVVHKQTQATAETVGLLDRGVIRPGYRADINVIAMEGLSLAAPRFVFDLPTGERRLVQDASGYRHTLVAGVEIRRDDESTGATPGRLIRGAQPNPA